MFYHLYEMNHAGMAPFRAVADATRLYFRNPFNPLAETPFGRSVVAAAELFERTTRRYGKPEFGIADTQVDGAQVAVEERTVWRRPFCALKHFHRDLPASRPGDPKLLIVAPLSGHYATLLRGTVEEMAQSHEVFITDWIDARMVPLSDGHFDLDDYIDYVIEMLRHLGPGTHVMAVCQPSVPVLAAVALMEEDKDPCAPASMTLMGGPIDTRMNPTEVNKIAEVRGTEWFRRNVIMRVPFPHPGFMRAVYPGFLQLSGFMSMNMDRHVMAHREFFRHLVEGDGDSAEKHRDFYDEYLAVMDLTAEFYLQTVKTVFVEHALPNGKMMHRGRPVRPEAIRRCGLMTVEGERDDISGVGQTKAAHWLCSNIPMERKQHHLQPKVGHYGVFNGTRFRSEIAPRISDFIRKNLLAEATALNGAAAAIASDPDAEAGARLADALGLTALQTAVSPELVDDLTEITGIGPKLSETLNELGIYQYEQLGSLTSDLARALDRMTGVNGRASRHDWIGQARRLAGLKS